MEPDPEDNLTLKRNSISSKYLKESYASSDNGSQHRIITGVQSKDQLTKSAVKIVTQNAHQRRITAVIKDKSRNQLKSDMQEVQPPKVVLSTTEFNMPLKRSSPTPLARISQQQINR